MSPTSGAVVEHAAVLNLSDLESMNLAELRGYAQEAGLSGISTLKKQDLIFRLLQAQAEREGNIFASGVLEIVEDGYGFMRQNRFLPGPNDIYVSLSQVRRFGLRTGDQVTGQVRPPKDAEKYFGLLRVEAVNGVDPDTARLRPHFDELVPLYPTERFQLEGNGGGIAGRLIDLIAPIGKGQRGLVVGPPNTGKTALLADIARGIAHNSPSAHVIMLLVGERPEDVTAMQREIRGEVIHSTFDEHAERHVHVAEMALERGRRLVEAHRDVVILLDSLTRLTRAYSLVVPPSHRTLPDGLDASAFYPPKRLLGSARNVERGGSLTIIATCTAGSGNRMDDGVYEELKGTANLELVLDPTLHEHRVLPAIDIARSGTRHEELLHGGDVVNRVWTMRRMVEAVGTVEGTEMLLHRLAKSPDNDAFLESLTKDVA